MVLDNPWRSGQEKAVTRYYMVHGHGPASHVPRVMHPTAEAAEREARRLSMAHRGVVFTVLKVVDAFYMPPEAPHRLPVTDSVQL